LEVAAEIRTTRVEPEHRRSNRALMGLIGCSRQDPLQREVIMLQDRTIPLGDKQLETIALIRKHSDATASWIFEKDRDWNTYTAWVVANLPAYARESTGPALRLVRRLHGDLFELKVEHAQINDVEFARVNFRAVAQ
jgi:hypothetical protein